MAPILLSACRRRLLNLLLLLFYIVLLLLVSDHCHHAAAFPSHSHRTGVSISAYGRSKNKLQHRRRQWQKQHQHQHQHKSASTVIPIGSGHSLPPISDRNLELNTTEALVYDPEKDRFVRASSSRGLAALYSIDYTSEGFSTRLKRAVRHAFVPQGVNRSYFHFMKWRILQRFINSNLHVLGTQSLIMGLGIKSAKTLGETC